MSEPVPGWAPVDEDALLDPARRPIREILREVVAVYRRHARPILLLAALFEGAIGLFTLPYLVLSIRLSLRMLDLMGRFFVEPFTARNPAEIANAFDQLLDPGVAVYGGLASFAPLASAVLLTGAVAALLSADHGQPTAGAAAAVAARSVLRRWPAFLLPIAILAVVVGALSLWSSAVSADYVRQPMLARDPGSLGPSIALSLLIPVVAVGLIYLAVRWAVAIPALVLEGIGLRAALARSSALTARRRLHVALCLVSVGVLTGIVGWVVLVPFYVGTAAIMAADGGPILALPLALYLVGRIVLAPPLPILGAILYRDFRAAGPRTSGRPAIDPESPPGWGSAG